MPAELNSWQTLFHAQDACGEGGLVSVTGGEWKARRGACSRLAAAAGLPTAFVRTAAADAARRRRRRRSLARQTPRLGRLADIGIVLSLKTRGVLTSLSTSPLLVSRSLNSSRAVRSCNLFSAILNSRGVGGSRRGVG